jgi:hypothetical protein
MTEHDWLEQELSAMRPHEPSAEMKRRIAAQLAASPAHAAGSRNNYWRGGAFIGGLLAASLAAVLAWDAKNPAVAPERPAATPHRTLEVQFDPALPSLWSYRAGVKSPDSLDALLAKFTDHRFTVKSGGAPGFSFSRLKLSNDSSLGEL